MSEQPPPADDPGRPPTEEELRAYAERLKEIRVEDIIAETLGPLINVGTLRAGLVPGAEDAVNLEQLRKAIEASRALIPLVERELGPQAPAVRGAVSNLQIAYSQIAGRMAEGAEGAPDAAAAGPGPGTPQDAPPAGGEGGQQPPPAPAEEPIKPGEPGPAQRSGRLWVPGQ
jgi:hypothetical protein